MKDNAGESEQMWEDNISVLYEKVVVETNSQQNEWKMDVGKEDMDGAGDRIKRIMLQDAAEAHEVIKYEEGDLVE